MSTVSRSFIAGGLTLLGIGAVVAGLVIRDRQDLGSGAYLSDADQAEVGGLLASRQGAEVPADRYFAQMVEKLKQEYVDPIGDDQKLAAGSVRGMINSLGDPNSRFMDAKEFAAYKREVEGHYEGIGAEIAIEDSGVPKGQVSENDEDLANATARVPKLAVVGLIPGGPAEKAGVQLGDTVEYVNGRWVMQADDVARLTALTKAVSQHTAQMTELIKVRKELRPRFDKSVVASKARDEIMMGTEGSVDITWLRNGKEVKSVIARGSVDLPAFGPDSNGTIHLSFSPGDALKLRDAVKGKDVLTLDLRHAPAGDFPTMKACLADLAPNGDYGVLDSERKDKAHPLAVADGNAKPPKLTLLVDKSTRGPAEIFALALQSKGLAKLVGGPMAGRRVVIETVPLPDGSGYTLATATYRPPAEKATFRSQHKPQRVARIESLEVDA